MMPLEQQVPKRELCERMKELGFPQDSLLYFCSDLGELTFSKNCEPYEKRKCGDHLAAPTVAELGEILPKVVNGFPLLIEIIENRWCFNYVEHDNGGYEYRFETEGDTLIEAMAAMWIYLRENGLI